MMVKLVCIVFSCFSNPQLHREASACRSGCIVFRENVAQPCRFFLWLVYVSAVLGVLLFLLHSCWVLFSSHRNVQLHRRHPHDCTVTVSSSTRLYSYTVIIHMTVQLHCRHPHDCTVTLSSSTGLYSYTVIIHRTVQLHCHHP